LNPVIGGTWQSRTADLLLLRQAGPLRFVRLSERYADLDETGFVLLGLFDSNKMPVAATYPWKFLRNAKT